MGMMSAPLAQTGNTEPGMEEDTDTEVFMNPYRVTPTMHYLSTSQAYRWSIMLAVALLIVLFLGPTILFAAYHGSKMPVHAQSVKVNGKDIVSLDATIQTKKIKKKFVNDALDTISGQLNDTDVTLGKVPGQIHDIDAELGKVSKKTKDTAVSNVSKKKESTAMDSDSKKTEHTKKDNGSKKIEDAAVGTVSVKMNDTVSKNVKNTVSNKMKDTVSEKVKGTVSKKVKDSPRINSCQIGTLNDREDCKLKISLRSTVNVSGLHLFARKYKALKQIHVIEKKREILLTFPGEQILDCCDAYNELVVAPVVKSIDLTQDMQ